MKTIFISLLTILLSTACANSYNTVSDSAFLERQMIRIQGCIQKNIEISNRQNNTEISRIYKACQGLTDTYDSYVMVGKSNSFKYEYVANQRIRWYLEINNQIAKFNPATMKDDRDKATQKRTPLYFYSQLKGSLIILNNSFKYCDFSNASKLDFTNTLSSYVSVIEFTNQLIELDLTIKNPNVKSYIVDFEKKALTILETHIQNSFTNNKENTCLNVKNQLLGNDRKIIELIGQTIDSIDGKLLDNPNIKVAIQKVKNALAALDEIFKNKKV